MPCQSRGYRPTEGWTSYRKASKNQWRIHLIVHLRQLLDILDYLASLRYIPRRRYLPLLHNPTYPAHHRTHIHIRNQPSLLLHPPHLIPITCLLLLTVEDNQALSPRQGRLTGPRIPLSLRPTFPHLALNTALRRPSHRSPRPAHHQRCPARALNTRHLFLPLRYLPSLPHRRLRCTARLHHPTPTLQRRALTGPCSRRQARAPCRLYKNSRASPSSTSPKTRLSRPRNRSPWAPSTRLETATQVSSLCPLDANDQVQSRDGM